MSTVTFYTTFPKFMSKEEIDDTVDTVIPHGVRSTDIRKSHHFQQVFIKCLDDRKEVRDLMDEMKSASNGRARRDYDLGGEIRGYLLISVYKPKEKKPTREQPRRPRTDQRDIRKELTAMMMLTRDLEKEIARLQEENAALRTRAGCTTELPAISTPRPASPGYCPTSPTVADTEE